MAVMYTQRRADWQETGAFIYRKPGVCLHAGPAAGSLLAEALGCLSRDASSSPVFHYSSPFFCLKKTNDDDRFIQTYHGGYFFSTFSHLRNNCYARRVLFSFSGASRVGLGEKPPILSHIPGSLPSAPGRVGKITRRHS